MRWKIKEEVMLWIRKTLLDEDRRKYWQLSTESHAPTILSTGEKKGVSHSTVVGTCNILLYLEMSFRSYNSFKYERV